MELLCAKVNLRLLDFYENYNVMLIVGIQQAVCSYKV